MLIIFLAGVTILIIVFAKYFDRFRDEFYSKPPEEKLDYPYHRKDYLLTAAEKNFYEVLKPICDERNTLVFAKVRLEDLVWTPKYTKHPLKWRGYVRSRHIDFVLCDRENIKPLCAIELDDSTHDLPKTIETDKVKDDILAAAGLPLLRINTSSFYDPAILLLKIKEKLN
ncbi:MAG: DUF2726 domain-containing protein [Candidatus Pacebacteria bacterium]|nr:DUF2726 domain-containing protein [Candidatus Paceibacterota bacterium]